LLLLTLLRLPLPPADAVAAAAAYTLQKVMPSRPMQACQLDCTIRALQLCERQ
jgi:hypothetical protein